LPGEDSPPLPQKEIFCFWKQPGRKPNIHIESYRWRKRRTTCWSRIRIMEPVHLQSEADTETKTEATQGQMPILEALQSADTHTRCESTAATQNLLNILHLIAEKRRNVEETMEILLRETRAEQRMRRWRIVKAAGFSLTLLWLFYATWDTTFVHFWWIVPLS